MEDRAASFPRPSRDELEPVLRQVFDEARAYLAGIDERVVREPGCDAAAEAFGGPLPEHGVGATVALAELARDGFRGAAHTAGPRCFHFVMGGATPAALGADWFATLLDQLAYAWVSSPLAVRLEQVVLGWLRDLFELPPGWSGVTTTGATMANFVNLAVARQWCGQKLGVDVAEQGLYRLEPIPVFAGGYLHPAADKALSMLGMGRGTVRRCARDAVGRFDVDALARGLADLAGRPAIVCLTAGEPTAGDFDPIFRVAEVVAGHPVWLHIDGAFGLFARVSPRTRALCDGIERAQSLTVDGHKWLNVPYDCGFALNRAPDLMGHVFRYAASYLARPDDARPVPGGFGPESSRRARSFAAWATLKAYGKSGVRAVVEGNLDRAAELAALVDAAPDLERLAEVPLNVVCFRARPPGVAEAELDDLNERLGRALVDDGRFLVGTGRHDGKVALRPAISSWRTRPEDIAEFVAVVRQLAHGVAR
jgi:glutamate/tyrosine decarboxylase-like PLP-dependent enzyme